MTNVGENTKNKYKERYWESTQETLVGLYGKRDAASGLPLETIDDIIRRVARAVAVAELKYFLSPEEIISLTVEQALQHSAVKHWAEIFEEQIGNQKFWANTPANINADAENSLKVLQYWAHGVMAGLDEESIWLGSEELQEAYGRSGELARAAMPAGMLALPTSIDEGRRLALGAGGDARAPSGEALRAQPGRGDAMPLPSGHHGEEMGRLATELRGKGCLAACGVAYVDDSLESIQEAARMEALAAKAAMGMGLNTSTLRPWSSIIANGAAASGPDRFYEKTISKAVEAVAQGGRRGGALIEIRNSDHPDILIFIDKKKLLLPPHLPRIFEEMLKQHHPRAGEDQSEFKKRVLALAEAKFGEQFVKFIEQQNYLKNTNVTVLAMPGFMQAVEEKGFYQAKFNGELWYGPLYDPRKPVIDESTGSAKINRLTKEMVYEEYSVDLKKYPEALEAARKLDNASLEITDTAVRVRGFFYAPDVFGRIIEGMRDSGEPGIAFYETVNAGNANRHVYDLNTCNPCGEQFLPAGRGRDGRTYMGNCNLSSLHAAHQSFFNPNGSYKMSAMRRVAKIQQRFMDNVTDVSWYPLPAQNMTARFERRNGGGFAGIAEFLSRLEVEFGSSEGLQKTEELFRNYTEASLEASMELAKERGVYPLWPGSRFEEKNLRVRNSCLTNNAPTGTLAQALQTSWGVDPHNGIVFSRKVRSRYVDFVAPGFKDLMEKYGAWPATEEEQNQLMKRIRDNHKSCRGLDEIPEPVQSAFPVRVEVEPEAYIRHLAAIHKGASEYPETFNSVSNTCSIPLNYNEQAIADAILLAWKLGVKDVTFYPDGSRLSQPVEQIAREGYGQQLDLLSLLGHRELRKINIEETTGLTYKVRVGTPDGGSTLHVSLNHEVDRPGELVEVYARMGKPGAIEAGLFEAVGRLASSFLQYAAQFGEEERSKAEQTIVRQLINIQSGYPAFFKFQDSSKAIVIQSPCDGLAKAIQQYRRSFKKHFRKKQTEHSDRSDNQSMDDTDPPVETKLFSIDGSVVLQSTVPCSKCGSEDWAKVEGCLVCQSCGFSKCG